MIQWRRLFEVTVRGSYVIFLKKGDHSRDRFGWHG